MGLSSIASACILRSYVVARGYHPPLVPGYAVIIATTSGHHPPTPTAGIGPLREFFKVGIVADFCAQLGERPDDPSKLPDDPSKLPTRESCVKSAGV